MNDIKQLKQEIEQLRNRNKRVELEKAWETSLFRKILIAVLTYVVVVIFFAVSKAPNPALSAIVPTLGYVLSTLSIPIFKKWWMKRNGK